MLDFDFFNFGLNFLQQLDKLHRQSHIAGNFYFALEKGLLWVDFACDQLGDIFVVDDEGDIGFIHAIVGDFAFSYLCIDDPISLRNPINLIFKP